MGGGGTCFSALFVILSEAKDLSARISSFKAGQPFRVDIMMATLNRA
jgi:hypothetical protein